MAEKKAHIPEVELKTSTKKAQKDSNEADALKAQIEALNAEIENLKAENEGLKSEIKEKDDKHLRMAAEYDNFRRRSREEKEGIYEAALADTVSEILPIIDNLERAAMYEGGDKVLEGLVMTAKATISVFEKLGIEEVGKVGEKFDPNLHNAVLHVDDEAYEEGEIIEVLQKGFKKGKRIIRFAMVKTAN